MSNLLLIPENLMGLSNAMATTSSSASASMAGTNMLTESPSEFWRSESNWPTKCASYFNHNGYSSFAANAIALIGHNLERGDQYRIWVNESETLATRPSGVTLDNPTGTVAGTTTNTAATFADVDNGETLAPGTWATPTSPGAAWSLGLSFPTPAGIINGADLQAFWVFAKTSTNWPGKLSTLTVDLYESGVFVASLGTRTVRSTTGQVMCFPFDAELLATSSGANIECKISSTPRSTLDYISVGSVVLATDRDARAGDSGWLTYDPFDGGGITFRPEVQGSGSAILYRFPLTYNPYYIHIHIRSSRSPTDFVATEEIHPLTHNYVQIGSVVTGESWSPAADRNFGPLVSTKDYSSKSRTYGGQRFGSRRFVQRILSIPLDWLTPTEAHTLFDRILWRHGILKPILVSILPGDSVEEKHTTFLASLRNPENAMVATSTRGKSRGMTLEFEEEL